MHLFFLRDNNFCFPLPAGGFLYPGIPPDVSEASSGADRNIFIGEVKRIVNFAALADNQTEILYGELKQICESLRINLFEMLEEEYQQYN